MIDISVSNLVKEFEVGHKILDGLTFQVDTGERVGLLGPNGCGKTTLLRILTGVMDYDEGDVVIAPGKRMGLISQIPVYPAGYTVEDVLATAFEPLREMEREMAALAEQMGEGTDSALLARYDKLTAAFEAAGGYETDTKTNKVCNGLTIPQSMREQLFDKLSGGEKRRLYLLRILMGAPNVLVLDEPTNDLDIQTLTILEDYLDGFQGIVIVVSHDRYFLDRTVRRIFAFEEEGKIRQYEGGWTDWQAARKEEEAERISSAKSLPTEEIPKKSREGRTHSQKLKFTYKEQREFDTIEDDIAVLEKKLGELEAAIGEAASQYTKLEELMKEKEAAERALEEKMDRWVYLNDLAERIQSKK